MTVNENTAEMLTAHQNGVEGILELQLSGMTRERDALREQLRTVALDRDAKNRQWDKLNETFCQMVREVSDSEGVTICEPGLERFCVRMGLEYVPDTIDLEFTIKISATVKRDDADEFEAELSATVEFAEYEYGDVSNINSISYEEE